VRTILQFYLKIRTLEEIEISKKDTPNGGFMNVMKTVLTLGIAGDPINISDKDPNGRVIKLKNEKNRMQNYLLFLFLTILQFQKGCVHIAHRDMQCVTPRHQASRGAICEQLVDKPRILNRIHFLRHSSILTYEIHRIQQETPRNDKKRWER